MKIHCILAVAAAGALSVLPSPMLAQSTAPNVGPTSSGPGASETLDPTDTTGTRAPGVPITPTNSPSPVPVTPSAGTNETIDAGGGDQSGATGTNAGGTDTRETGTTTDQSGTTGENPAAGGGGTGNSTGGTR